MKLQNSAKTYIGTQIEIALRKALKLRRGVKLDMVVDGVEVDVKSTLQGKWWIPPSGLEHPCLLISEDERAARCHFGVIVARKAYITRSETQRDTKRGLAAASAFDHVL